MRVGIVTSSYPLQPGSYAGHFVASEARALLAEGHRVFVCCPGAPGSWQRDGIRGVSLGAQQLFDGPGALPRLKANPLRALWALPFVLRARAALQQHGPFDRMQAHWLLPCGWPIAAACEAPLQIVCHGSDIGLLERLPRALSRHILRSIADSQAQLRCVSHDLQQRLLALDPSLAARCSVQPCALDLSAAPTRDQARAVLQVGADELLLIVSRLIPSKRVDLMLTSLTFRPEAPRARRTVVIGSGPEMPALRTRHPQVHFLGELPREQTLHWIAAADLLLTASAAEGAPTVVREARALGVPVLACAVGDLPLWARLDRGLHLLGANPEPSTIAGAIETALDAPAVAAALH